MFLKGARPPPPLQTHPHTHTMREKRRYNGALQILAAFGGRASQPTSQPARGGGGGGVPKPPSHPATSRRSSVVDLIAELEGVEPQQRKKWSKILDAFGAPAFAIAPLHSTFMRQINVVSDHRACLLTLHCALSGRVVKGILQVPQDRLWLLREMAEATLYLSCSKSASNPRTPAVHWEVLGCTPNPNLCTPLTHAFLVMAHLTWRATNVMFFIVPCMRPSDVNR